MAATGNPDTIYIPCLAMKHDTCNQVGSCIKVDREQSGHCKHFVFLREGTKESLELEEPESMDTLNSSSRYSHILTLHLLLVPYFLVWDPLLKIFKMNNQKSGI